MKNYMPIIGQPGKNGHIPRNIQRTKTETGRNKIWTHRLLAMKLNP